MRAIDGFLKIALVLLALVLLVPNSSGNAIAANASLALVLLVPNSSGNAIAANASLSETVDSYKGIYFSVIEIFASLLLIGLVMKLYLWARRDEGLLILPFEVAKSDDKCDFCGKAISDLLIAELQRIKQINSQHYKDIKTENVIMPSTAPIGEGATIPQLGTIGAGSTSISIGELLATIKRLASRNSEITCSMQKYGSVISLTACLARIPRKQQTPLSDTSATKKQQKPPSGTDELAGGHIWEVHERTNDERIPELVRDLSFKIAYDLSRYLSSESKISAKIWQAFKYYTEALNSYGQYTRSGERDIKYLDNARENCILAINVERDYEILIGLLDNLGNAYFNKKMYPIAEEMFSKSIEINPQNAKAWNNRGAALNRQGEALYAQGKHDEAMNAYIEAVNACKKAIELDSSYPVPWNNKGYALNRQGEALYAKGEHDKAMNAYSEAINACNEAIKLDITNNPAPWNNKGYALYRKGEVLYGRGKHDEAMNAYSGAINACNKAIGLYANSPLAWNNKATALNRQGEALNAQGKHDESMNAYSEAINACNEAIKLDPKLANAYQNLCKALEALGRFDEANEARAMIIELMVLQGKLPP